MIREEPLVWIGSPKMKIEPDQPLPLALGATTCQWRQTAERILHEAGRDHRIVLVSNNYSAIEPMVRTRLALDGAAARCGAAGAEGVRPGRRSAGIAELAHGHS